MNLRSDSVRRRVGKTLVMTGFVSAVLGGCTDLEVRRLGHGVTEGIPYYLPKKSFLVSAEYVLNECALDQATPPNFRFRTTKTITILPLVEPDEKEKFYIPYSSLRNAFKDTDISVENYENLTLKSVNATVSDKTGETITALIGTSLRVASLAGGVNLLAKSKTGPRPRREDYCGTEAISRLDEYVRLSALAAANAPASADLVAQVAAAKAALTFKQVLRWTPSKPTGAVTVSRFETTLYPSVLVGPEKWITQKGIDELKAQKGGDSLVDQGNRVLALVTHIALDTLEPVSADLDPETFPKGFRLRNPVLGLLRACEVQCPIGSSGATNNVLIAAEYAVPQLGDYIVIPLKNRVFETQTLEINLSADGVITKMGLKSNATALAAVTSINTDLDAIQKAKDARDKAKADAMQSALSKGKNDANQVKDENEAIAACRKAQTDVAAAGGTPVGTCQ
jgi:hypothetical protein